MTDTSRERGMLTKEMNVVRAFMRKTKSTRATKMPPSTSDLRMFDTEALMNASWR